MVSKLIVILKFNFYKESEPEEPKPGFLQSFVESAKKAKQQVELELKPKRKKQKQKPESKSVEEPESIKMYLPRRPGGFFKGVLIFSIFLMLIIIFNNADGKALCF